MFQTASYPAHPFPSQGHVRSPHHSQFAYQQDTPSYEGGSGVQLPRTLARPSFVEVSRSSIAAVAPELADVPLEYTRRHLRSTATQMMAGVSSIASGHIPSSMPKSQLPRSMTVPVRAPSPPTHILALSPASKSGSSSEVFLHPTHALVLAAHCAKLPTLPASHPSSSRSSATLPVLPLTLPSPQTFPALHYYLYTHDAPTLLAQLFPKHSLPSSFLSSLSASPSGLKQTLASGKALHQLSTHLVQSCRGELPALMGVAGVITGLWRNVVALGISDPDLWDGLDLSWEILLGALNLAAPSA